MLKRLRRWLFGGSPAPGASFAPARPADPPPPAREPAPAVAADPAPDSATSGLPFEIRPYRDGDAAALARVFRNAILVTAADHYDADQRRAWSAAADDPAFPADLAKGLTMVAEWQQETAGFAQLVDDRITLIYVHPDTASAWSPKPARWPTTSSCSSASNPTPRKPWNATASPSPAGACTNP